MLITLVIIGIIAALTIPNLLQKYQEQATVKKVQKFYSNLSNAYALAKKDNGTAREWGLTGADKASAEKIYNILFKPNFKIAKNCGVDNTGNCMPNTNYKALDNSSENNFSILNTMYKIVLDDGAIIWWHGPLERDNIDIAISYDINGIKGPNQMGKDTFQFGVRNENIFPAGMQAEEYAYLYYFPYSCLKTGTGCAAWVIYKGNMDYLHCSDLSWTGKSKCK